MTAPILATLGLVALILVPGQGLACGEAEACPPPDCCDPGQQQCFDMLAAPDDCRGDLAGVVVGVQHPVGTRAIAQPSSALGVGSTNRLSASPPTVERPGLHAWRRTVPLRTLLASLLM